MTSKEQLALHEIVPESISHCAAKAQEICAEAFNVFASFHFTESCAEIKNVLQKTLYLSASISCYLSFTVFIFVLVCSDSLTV